MESRIREIPERCTGCRVCQLVCSMTYQGRFAPQEAYLLVEEKGPCLTEECTGCGLCADHCPSEALVREEEA
jgi:NAD-dependent dihydropyrimidine dehydrogenase PreA subunit